MGPCGDRLYGDCAEAPRRRVVCRDGRPGEGHPGTSASASAAGCLGTLTMLISTCMIKVSPIQLLAGPAKGGSL